MSIIIFVYNDYIVARFRLPRGDVFVIPSWNDVQWTVGPESCLLQASDEILLEKLNWLHSGAPGSEMHDAEARFRAKF